MLCVNFRTNRNHMFFVRVFLPSRLWAFGKYNSKNMSYFFLHFEWTTRNQSTPLMDERCLHAQTQKSMCPCTTHSPQKAKIPFPSYFGAVLSRGSIFVSLRNNCLLLFCSAIFASTMEWNIHIQSHWIRLRINACSFNACSILCDAVDHNDKTLNGDSNHHLVHPSTAAPWNRKCSFWFGFSSSELFIMARVFGRNGTVYGLKSPQTNTHTEVIATTLLLLLNAVTG